ncbi:MAG: LarC family nickel insertion protein, partial [Deltaproteobacteria bacterium]|nr:LarC family nickel insertion protein [Deltaproteobacteria bacterium]
MTPDRFPGPAGLGPPAQNRLPSSGPENPLFSQSLSLHDSLGLGQASQGFEGFPKPVGSFLAKAAPMIVIRPHSGISGDMMVAGLLALSGGGQEALDDNLARLGLESLAGKVKLTRRSVGGVSGLGLAIDIPPEGTHRTMADIREFFLKADISQSAKKMAVGCFALVAEAEGQVHELPPEEVGFHEVGALDSLMDIGLSCALFDSLGAPRLVCGPLPVADGAVRCAHGVLPSPAPAVAILLEGVAVRGFGGEGETVTPTGLALLKCFGAQFGPWPAITIDRQAMVYGTKTFPGVPNGAL